MRIGLLDPRWVEQRDRQIQEKMNQETVYAPGTGIFLKIFIFSKIFNADILNYF